MHLMRARQAATPQAATAAAAESFNTIGQVAGIWGYVLDDEPPVATLPYLEALQNELLRLDPIRSITTEPNPYPRSGNNRSTSSPMIPTPLATAMILTWPTCPNLLASTYRHVNESLGRQCAQRGMTLWGMSGTATDKVHHGL